MPYRMVYEPAPKNPSLPVYKELPEEYRQMAVNKKEAYLLPKYNSTSLPDIMHLCHHCSGWIPGRPSIYYENNIGLLSGRDGMTYYCQRCGGEIEFIGIVS